MAIHLAAAGRIIFAAVFCIGVLFLFFGYRVFKVTLFIIGFLVGAGITVSGSQSRAVPADASLTQQRQWLGFSIMNPEVYDHVGTDEAESIMTGVIASILVGIASGACAIALYLLGIFLIGFAFGLFVGLITTAFIFQHTQGYIEHGECNLLVACAASASANHAPAPLLGLQQRQTRPSSSWSSAASSAGCSR